MRRWIRVRGLDGIPSFHVSFFLRRASLVHLSQGAYRALPTHPVSPRHLSILRSAGDTFASRVGVSLLRNAGEFQRALIATSRRDYEDLAVELISTPRGRRILGELRSRLHDGRPLKLSSARGDTGDPSAAGKGLREATLPLFDTRAITTDINRAFMAMSDLRDRIGCGEVWGNGCEGWRRYPHVFVTQQKGTGGEQDRDWEGGGV